jgi:phosphoribosylaminoimidazole carboxylase (NCAIR synthetase)
VCNRVFMAASFDVNTTSHIAKAEDVLASEFETVPRDLIHALLIREVSQFEAAKVRDFVPLLAAKAVRRRLCQDGDTIVLP